MNTQFSPVARREKLTFQDRARQLLAGRLERPADEPRAWAIFAHCFTCSKDIAAASRITCGLAALAGLPTMLRGSHPNWHHD